MRSSLMFVLFLSFTTGSTALASNNIDLALIRKLAPKGYIPTHQHPAKTFTDDQLWIAVKNWLIQDDFNGDKISDFLMIYESASPVASKQRKLMIYFGNKQNGFDLFLEKDHFIFGPDDGGAHGDPLNSLSISDKKAITIGYYGGSGERWEHNYTIQFRDGDFYLIGEFLKTYNLNEGETAINDVFEESSTNYITGQTIERSRKAKQKIVSKKYKQPIKKIKLKDYKNSYFDT